MDGSLIHTQIYYGTYEIVLERWRTWTVLHSVLSLMHCPSCTVCHVLPIKYRSQVRE